MLKGNGMTQDMQVMHNVEVFKDVKHTTIDCYWK